MACLPRTSIYPNYSGSERYSEWIHPRRGEWWRINQRLYCQWKQTRNRNKYLRLLLLDPACRWIHIYHQLHWLRDDDQKNQSKRESNGKLWTERSNQRVARSSSDGQEAWREFEPCGNVNHSVDRQADKDHSSVLGRVWCYPLNHTTTWSYNGWRRRFWIQCSWR